MNTVLAIIGLSAVFALIVTVAAYLIDRADTRAHDGHHR